MSERNYVVTVQANSRSKKENSMSEGTEKKTFKFSSKASKEAAQKQKEKTGYAYKSFKLTGEKARLLILAPIDEKESVFHKVVKHQVWGLRDGKKAVIAEAASPTAFGEKDKIMQTGFKLRTKYLKSKNEKIKTAWRSWMPKDLYYINVLDLDKLEAGPQVYLVPNSIFQTIQSELEDLDYDLEKLCDFTDGRVLQVKSNGQEGMQKRYDSKFLTTTAGEFLDKLGTELTSKDIEEIASKVYSLSKLQPKANEEDLDKVEAALEKYAQKLGLDVDGSDDEEDEDEEEVVETKKKSSKKSHDEDEDEEEEDDFDSEISSIDDEDDEEEVKPKQKSKKVDLDDEEDVKPKSKNKKVEVDEDEEEFDLDSEDEEEDETPPPSKKKLRRG